jgi:uncharacterized protein (TIGR00299 family) protein
MHIAILDPAAGISGDMILGALIDSGLDASWIEGLPARVGFPTVRTDVRSVERCGVRAVKVDFLIDGTDADHGRVVPQLIEIVRRADVSEQVKQGATKAFELLSRAEGRVHGVAPDQVHLHEVGAIDAVLDLVGALEGFERLGIDAVFNFPVAIGRGWVDAAHGKLPIPAPATLELLEGIEVVSDGPGVGEATTPTGAVLLRVLSAGPPPSPWRPVRTGWGAGSRDPEGHPNALRLIVAEAAAEAGVVEVIATDIDDLPLEYLETLRRAVLDAGAVDCQTWPTQGKKGRVSVRVETLVSPEAADRVTRALFEHSTTAGVRKWRTVRSTLSRHDIIVELERDIRVRIKVREGLSGQRLKCEYDDVVAAAGTLGRPALEIAREAERLAYAALENGRDGVDSKSLKE